MNGEPWSEMREKKIKKRE